MHRYLADIDVAREKKAILVVSFGTSYNENRAKTIGAIENAIAKEFPDWEVRRAFTSKMIIKKLEKRDGELIDYVDEALGRLIADGFKTVVVQPTHIMNGQEHEDIMHVVYTYTDNFDKIVMGRPLLSTEKDYEIAVKAIEKTIVKEAEKMSQEKTAIVLMGHGTGHYANSAYCELQMKLLLMGFPNIFMTTVEGFPSFEDTLLLMDSRGYKNVILSPFMLVAGDHANNDMAGDDEDSLRSVMAKHGYTPFCIVKGLGEYPEFEKIFVAHVKDVIKNL